MARPNSALQLTSPSLTLRASQLNTRDVMPRSLRARAESALNRTCGRLGIVEYRGRITLEPGKRGGKPCIRGLRITVYDVLDYLASGITEEEILGDFPDLERDDIRACLAFAADRERKLVSATTDS